MILPSEGSFFAQRTRAAGLAAVLAADVAGYSRLMGCDEERTLAQLKTLRKTLVDPAIATHRGRIVTTGDGMLVEFASAVDAARCAIELQRQMAGRNGGVPPELRIEFRIGIHVGDIIIDDGDIFGDGVNIAACLTNPRSSCCRSTTCRGAGRSAGMEMARSGLLRAILNPRTYIRPAD
jgi:adenylate cyclase